MFKQPGESFRGRLQWVDEQWQPYYSDTVTQEYSDPLEKTVIPALNGALRGAADERYLLWEELEAGPGNLARLVRHRTPLGTELPFVQTGLGVSFVVEQPEGSEEAGDSDSGFLDRHPWIPNMPEGPMPPKAVAQIGWSPAKPQFWWFYGQSSEGGPPAIEVSWRLEGLPVNWLEEGLVHLQEVPCLIDGESFPLMRRETSGVLWFHGRLPLAADAGRPPRRQFHLRAPLVVVEGGTSFGDIEGLQVATVEAADYVAILPDRETRLVTRADLDLSLEAEVLVVSHVLLPETLPAAELGLPWDLEATALGEVERELKPPTQAVSEGPQVWRRWQLRPRLGGAVTATWREVFPGAYLEEEPCISFGLGASVEAPEIRHVADRTATITWNIGNRNSGRFLPQGAEGHDTPLYFCTPQWLPSGYPLDTPLPIPVDEFEFQPEVEATFRGLRERFHLDPSSELPRCRLLLEADRWRSWREEGEELYASIVLGAAEGYVRWRRAPGRRPRPADWARGSAPVLLVEKVGEQVDTWGGLYVPPGESSAEVPWVHLEEVLPAWDGELRRYSLTVRPTATMVWLALWGFLSRFDRRKISVQAIGSRKSLVAWISDAGLPLFPPRRDLLLRSFSPLYCIKNRDKPRRLHLDASIPRPTLEIGEDLFSEDGLRSIQLSKTTRMWTQIVERDERPDDFGWPGNPGGKPFLLKEDLAGRVLWLLLERPLDPSATSREEHELRLVLSWDRDRGWCFRGFYDEPSVPVPLGPVYGIGPASEATPVQSPVRPAPLESGFPMVLDDGRNQRQFHLVFENGCPKWHGDTPKEALAVSPKELLRWAEEYFDRSHTPAALARFDHDDAEFLGETVRVDFRQHHPVVALGRILAIRAWQPRPGSTDEDLRGRPRNLAGPIQRISDTSAPAPRDASTAPNPSAPEPSVPEPSVPEPSVPEPPKQLPAAPTVKPAAPRDKPDDAPLRQGAVGGIKMRKGTGTF